MKVWVKTHLRVIEATVGGKWCWVEDHHNPISPRPPLAAALCVPSTPMHLCALLQPPPFSSLHELQAQMSQL